MSRKDFELIAQAVRTMRVDLDANALRTVENRLADALKTTNGRFDRLRFIAACQG